MTVLERLRNSIVVPVVVLDDVKDAVPTVKAMAAGGVDVAEITFRTAAAPECIKAVSENFCGRSLMVAVAFLIDRITSPWAIKEQNIRALNSKIKTIPIAFDHIFDFTLKFHKYISSI